MKQGSRFLLIELSEVVRIHATFRSYKEQSADRRRLFRYKLVQIMKCKSLIMKKPKYLIGVIKKTRELGCLWKT